ncbi:IMP cyclohydrolase [Methanobrevibacter curvatus]|uniref:IMP cyclohydrolase n=1 Tax=Methanobrevibacter curvatus TaxID=49547 RepID=A0A166C659_9EURY|nr:IMP cyclohydrolase [Methanobrevibacter curvatus]
MLYLGRILSIGKNQDNNPFVAYRVSSRSFPNRIAKEFEHSAAIIPKEGYEKDIFENPYIAYNCLKVVGGTAIITNGSHTDVISDKIAVGMNIKDALTLSLLAMDYEKDDYNTPRIAAVVKPENSKGEYEAYVGIVTHEKILVERLKNDEAVYISTYECQSPEKVEFNASNSTETAEFIINKGKFEEFTNPVASVGAVFNKKWTIASKNL